MWRLIFSHIFDFIIPPRRRAVSLISISPEELMRLRTPSEHTYEAALPYHDARVTTLVWELKYYANKKAALIAADVIKEDLLAIAAEEIGKPLLIPIPMHDDRRRKRGHNQTEVLCEAVMEKLPHVYDYAPHALRRTRNTPTQQGLTKERREQNVYRAMEVRTPEEIRDRVCVVIDDVVTTGATLREAKRALLESGARKVVCVVLAAALNHF